MRKQIGTFLIPGSITKFKLFLVSEELANPDKTVEVRADLWMTANKLSTGRFTFGKVAITYYPSTLLNLDTDEIDYYWKNKEKVQQHTKVVPSNNKEFFECVKEILTGGTSDSPGVFDVSLFAKYKKV